MSYLPPIAFMKNTHLLFTLLSSLFICTHFVLAQEQEKTARSLPPSLSHSDNLSLMDKTAIFSEEPTEESAIWLNKLSRFVQLDRTKQAIRYQNGNNQVEMIDHLSNDPSYQKTTYLGELGNHFFLLKQDSWQGWKILAIQPELNKRIAFNLAEVFVSTDEQKLLVVNVPPESCQDNDSLSCPFTLTSYSIDAQNLTPDWRGQVNLPRAGFLIRPYWGKNQTMWLEITGSADDELYYLKTINPEE
ncbi:hypothetical protein [Neisseria sp. Ec49-e6-T10]|uniref:hypothetical protein n=1 Tax=Neisseria sp. Ec49-e6-T10 TaxID=3140744 RepID=UPI003EBBB38C